MDDSPDLDELLAGMTDDEVAAWMDGLAELTDLPHGRAVLAERELLALPDHPDNRAVRAAGPDA